jgi:hypothetical protein
MRADVLSFVRIELKWQSKIVLHSKKGCTEWRLSMRNVLIPTIPNRAKVFGWVLVVAGTFFAYVYMFNPGAFFPGVTVETFAEKFGLYSAGVRILGSVAGILVALLLNSAALLAIMLFTRIFIEAGDVVAGLVLNGGPDANTFTLLALAAVEVYMLIFLIKTLRKAP